MRVTIQRARYILADLELDSRLMNDRSAYVAMVCCGLNNSSQWDEAHKTSLGINDMILAINSGFPLANKGHGYKPNTRETIRDKTVKPFIANGLLSIEDPAISANSSKVRYTSSDHLVNLFKSVSKNSYKTELLRLKKVAEKRRSVYQNQRELEMNPVVLPDDQVVFISNEGQGPLVQSILESMLPKFAGGSQVLAMDTADGLKFFRRKKSADCCKQLEALISAQEKTAGNTPIYPDVIAYDCNKNWLFLIEACNSEGIFDDERKTKLQELLSPVFPNLIFITCFNSRTSMKTWLPDLAWETEVWVRDNPDHMIHLDGFKYLSPYTED